MKKLRICNVKGLLSNEYAIEKNLKEHACKNYQRIAYQVEK